MTGIFLFTAFVALAIGLIVFWTNPRRFLNQVFSLSSLLVTVWLLLVAQALKEGQSFLMGHVADPVPWLRANASLAGLFPWIIWLFKEAILSNQGRLNVLRRSVPWLVVGLLLSFLCYSDLFILPESAPESPRRGIAYTCYILASVLLYVALIIEAIKQTRTQSGVRRLEMQFVALNAGVACLCIILLNSAGNFLGERALSRLSPIAVLAFYGLTAWAVTFHRVFDARQVFLSLGQRVMLVLLLGLGVFAGTWLLAPVVPSPFDLFISVAAFGPLAFWLDRSSRDWLRLSPAQNVAEVRRAAAELARTQPSPEKLVVEFESLLRVEYQASIAQLLFDSGEVLAGSELQIAKSRTGYAALARSGWATPESLQRQRAAPGLVDLRQILTEHGLGLLVTAPRGSPDPTMIIALGVKTNKRPFTYPEVLQLQEIAEFMDNVLARSRLTLQARRSEQLAVIGLVGASLAHEIRNPLVSIKTFAHLLPSRFDDPDFRRKFHRLIPTEVDRIDNLTQQLLDLAHPRSHILEPASLHTIIRETIDLIQTNANEAQVTLTPRLQATPDKILADASAIRQVILNLVINAIQALESQTGDRIIEVSTRSQANGGIILEVSDNGPGISAEQRSRLFHPFASTKTKGIGLGLAICADILREHHATINVPDIGRPGATFRVTFPCPQPSS
jgi:signal transduction histidine kinase